MSATSKRKPQSRTPVQPAPPRHTTTSAADPEREPNPGDPGFPIIEPRTPSDPSELLEDVPIAPESEEASSAEPATGTRAKPGDEVPPGSPQSGENLCRRCGGSGAIAGQSCPACEGTGLVNTLVGDA